jgi:hypothetical protein
MRKHIDKIGFGIGYSGAILSALNMLFLGEKESVYVPIYGVVIGLVIIGIVLVCVSWVDRSPNEKKKT